MSLPRDRLLWFLWERFIEVCIIDRSRLDVVTHRLKLLREGLCTGPAGLCDRIPPVSAHLLQKQEAYHRHSIPPPPLSSHRHKGTESTGGPGRARATRCGEEGLGLISASYQGSPTADHIG